jgi:Carbohydrate family 9 binding domain-like
MKPRLYLFVITILNFSSILLAQNSYQDGEKVFPQPQINFSPQTYVCYRTNDSILVDGKLNEPSWLNAEWTNYFVDIEGGSRSTPRFKTRVKMLWNDKYLYVGAEIEEPNLWATITQHDASVLRDNAFEIFIDPDGDTYNYYEIEVNTIKTVWDLFLAKPYRDGGEAVSAFDIRGLKIGVNLKGTLNQPNDVDSGWNIEIAFPWSILKECAPNHKLPQDGDQWRINFSRVEWKLNVVNGKYKRELKYNTGEGHPEDDWAWSPQGIYDLHYPEMWGYVQFSNKIAGAGKDKFIFHKEEMAKWALRKVYYNERTFFMNNNKYTDDISKLGLHDYKVTGFVWPPKIELTQHEYEADLKSTNGKEIIIINNGGQVLIKPED